MGNPHFCSFFLISIMSARLLSFLTCSCLYCCDDDVDDDDDDDVDDGDDDVDDDDDDDDDNDDDVDDDDDDLGESEDKDDSHGAIEEHPCDPGHRLEKPVADVWHNA